MQANPISQQRKTSNQRRNVGQRPNPSNEKCRPPQCLVHSSIIILRGVLTLDAAFCSCLMYKATALSPQLVGDPGNRPTTADYARLAFTSATRMITRLPSALAARVIVSSVTETF